MSIIPLGLAIRDRTPEQLEAAGYQCRTRATVGRERSTSLRVALQQAVHDYLAAPDLKALAEINELVRALAQDDGHTATDLEKAREEAIKQEGSFDKGLILEALGPRPDFLTDN